MAKLIESAKSKLIDKMISDNGYHYLGDSHHKDDRNSKIYVHADAGALMIHNLTTNKVHFIHPGTDKYTTADMDKLVGDHFKKSK